MVRLFQIAAALLLVASLHSYIETARSGLEQIAATLGSANQ